MHGREGEWWRRRRHMCPVPASGAAATVATAPPHRPTAPCPAAAAGSKRCYPDSFLKDGRKICVGDCALFQARSSPAFIGIICWLSPGKEDYPKLGVNWLYRPSDIKLGKGILPEAAPNEVFYSFHKDEISAESLLHPCKVAFLSKGAELPSGISSFVCRRVYDIANKCLWWLTDQDYINEQQEEVDQLLDKTRLEMHAAVQSGGQSPKPLNSPSTQQLESGSDGVQNSALFSSQPKGKKGEKGDQSSESKQEHSLSGNDRDSGDLMLDSMIKTEIAKITDKGGLINNDAVEKLVQLMQLGRGERKIDLAGRLLLADVIAATSRNDCLGRFVQLRGVPVLDNWLQEAHRGRNGDGSPKEGDKSIEELLLALLRALDKLPINLNALQTCNIGKSVNHLRSHKKLEIQKKARSLVDTWKKRVDAEMTKLEMAKLSDAKSNRSSHTISWPGEPGLSEVSHGGNKRTCSSEVAVKNTIAQPSTCKSLPVKIGHGDSTMKSNPALSGSLKWSTTFTQVAIGTKDSQFRVGGSTVDTEPPLTMIKEEKGSAACQHQNISHPHSNDLAKAVGTSWKEDPRSSNAGLIYASKASGGASRHRKSSNGLTGAGFSAVPDGAVVKASSLSWNATSDKVLESGLAGDRSTDVPVVDHGNSHGLIVRPSNPGGSPTQSTSGGSFKDPVSGSMASFPGISEKNECIDHKTKLKNNVCPTNISADVNMKSWQVDDSKGLAGSDGGDGSPALLDEELGTVESRKEMDAITCSSEPKSKSFQASLNFINPLIESCVRYSEAGTSVCSGDDLGMNLLASVATGEMSASELVSPTGLPGENSAFENSCTVNEVTPKFPSDDVVTQVGLSEDHAEPACEKSGSTAVTLQVKDETQQNGTAHLTNSFGDVKCMLPLEKTGEHREQCPLSDAVSCKNAERNAQSEGKSADVETDEHVSLWTLPADIEDGSGEHSTYQLLDKQRASEPVAGDLPDGKQKVKSPSSDGSRSADCFRENIAECSMPLCDGNDIDHVSPGDGKCKKESVEGNSSRPLDRQNVEDEGLHAVIFPKQQVPSNVAACPDDVSGNVDNAMTASVSVNCSEIDESKKGKSDSMAAKSPFEPSGNASIDHTNLVTPVLDDRIGSSVLSTSNDTENFDKKVINHHSTESAINEEPPFLPTCKSEQCAMSMGSKLCGTKADVGKVACSVEASAGVISTGQDTSVKCEFDLNEGCSGDEGNTVEPVISSIQGCSSAVHLPNPSPFFVSPVSSGSSVPVTVMAPAKGSFVPPEALLKSKGEPRWKGSAATSAFHPAEPQKVVEMAVFTSEIPSSDAAARKQSHPPFYIDLNVPDERVLGDIASRSSALEVVSLEGQAGAPVKRSGVLDLDLNRADESTENVQVSASTSRSLGVPLFPIRPASGGFSLGEANVSRDFDLNNGPSLDVGVEQLPQDQHTKISTVPFLPSFRMNNNEPGKLSSWFLPGNSYPAVAMPPFLPDRDQLFPIVAAPAATQRILGSCTDRGTFGSGLYSGSLLSSSPAMAFPPTAAFPCPGFPFGSSFPLASTSFSGGLTSYVDSFSSGGPRFPAIPTTLTGTVAAAASPYVRPFVISLSDGSTGGGSESSWTWGQQGLDLNAGPGSIDIEGRRDERLPLTSRQLSVASSWAFAENQAKMYMPVGGGLKRKEPEGGWDTEQLLQKPPSWQ